MKNAENFEKKIPKSKVVEPHEVDEVMHSLEVSFSRYLGLTCDENPNPSCGYIFEYDVNKRDVYFGKAIRMRNKYAALVLKFGKGSELLKKMTDELTNAHIGSVWEDK